MSAASAFVDAYIIANDASHPLTAAVTPKNSTPADEARPRTPAAIPRIRMKSALKAAAIALPEKRCKCCNGQRILTVTENRGLRTEQHTHCSVLSPQS